MNKTNEISFFYLLKKLIPMCFKSCPRYILAFLPVSMSHVVTIVASTIASQYFFDTISVSVKQQNSSKVIILLFCFAILLIIQQLSNGFLNFMGWHMELKIKKHMLYKFHAKVSKLKAIIFESTYNLDTINKGFQGAQNTMEICGTLLMLITFYIPYFIFMGIYLFSIKPLLILSLILIFIPNLFTQVIRMKVFSKLEDEAAPIRREIDYNTSCFSDAIFLKETRQFGAFNFFINILKESIKLLGKKAWESELKTGLIELLLNISTLTGYIAILLMLVYFLIFNEISIGEFAAIFASIDTMFNLMQEIVCFHFGNLTQNTGTVMNFLRFMELEDPQFKDSIFDSNKDINLNNVSFSYPNTNRLIINNINLNIKKGETIAIVGENGSGKSTLSKLLIGLYEPTSGLVTIGGCDTKCTRPEVIFNNISGVFQTYQKYKMTVRDNISISNSKFTNDRKINELVKYFNLINPSEDPMSFLDTMLSREFDGIDLSGGEWQRVSIARGLYRNHNIIILDEPTASIDPLEEKYIFNKFSEIAKGKTSILITHRLGAVKIADRIIVMSDGKIKEEGTHESLMSINGVYATMYKEQSVWYK